MHKRPHHCLQWLLILVLQLRPVRGALNLGDTHLVHVTVENKVSPAADKHFCRALDVQRAVSGLRGSVEAPVHIQPRDALLVGVQDMYPRRQGDRTLGPQARPRTVTIHRHARRLVQDHLHNRLGFAIAPADDAVARGLGFEPDFRGVGTGPRGKGGDVVPAKNSLALLKAPTLTEDPVNGRGALILTNEHAGLILRRIVQVKDAEVAIAFVENRFAVGFAGRIGLAPEHFDLLMRMSFDHGDTHPDGGGSSCGVPRVNLIGQWLVVSTGEPKVVSLCFRLRKIEARLIQAHQ